jgi:hypothetical protein
MAKYHDRRGRPPGAALAAPAAAPPDADALVARVLDAPNLARLVPRLAPETLHHLIQHGGLAACGELVAAATPRQLTSLLDLDLWRHARPGRDEQFDADRFGEWVEVLVDTGEAVAARVVASLDEHLVVAGLSRYVRVFDVATFEPTASSDDEPAEAVVRPRGAYDAEIGGYLVSAIRPDAWDGIVALLTALEEAHADRFHALMRGCRGLSDSAPEVDGLDALLMTPAQWFHDVAADRDQRRSQQGYSTPADARAFLALARDRRRPTDTASSANSNPIAVAYFRAADETVAAPPPDASAPHGLLHAAANPDDSADNDDGNAALVDLLADAGLMPSRPRALLQAPPGEPSRLTRLRPLMEHVRETHDEAYFTRTRELAFLANTLMAGCPVQSRPFTAQEAADAAAAICNLGLEDEGDAVSVDYLVRHDLVSAFEAGWAVLHEDVTLAVTGQLIATLADLRCADAAIQRELNALRRQLVKQRRAGTPWLAREALEVLAMLDTPAWASLVGLLGECPVMAATLRATLHGRTGAISATAFEFIATKSQIGEIREFMDKLPDTLSR